MDYKEVENSFIHKSWYLKQDEIMNYNLSPVFMDMVRWGFGKLFTPENNEYVMPFQRFHFYCTNKDGYFKLFTKNIGHIDDLTVKELLNIAENLCNEFNLKFVGFHSEKYQWSYFENILGDDLKYEYNNEGRVILFFT